MIDPSSFIHSPPPILLDMPVGKGRGREGEENLKGFFSCKEGKLDNHDWKINIKITGVEEVDFLACIIRTTSTTAQRRRKENFY